MKMKRVGNLMQHIADLDNLYLAYYKASRGKRDKSEVMDFARYVDENVQKLRQQLLSGTVEVGHYRYFSIFDPKKRLICAASFPERVMHHAVMNVCHPYFERNFINNTFATRVGKGVYEAIGKAMKAMSRYAYVVKLDVRKYFDSISHEVLKAKLQRLFKDKALLILFDSIIDSYSINEGKGLPIGNLTSQYFANYYLSEMDHYAKEKLQVSVYLRYMDDILLFGDDKIILQSKVNALAGLANTLEIEFKPPILAKTEVGVSFLGYRLKRHRITLNARSRNRLRKKLIVYSRKADEGEWSEETFGAHLQPLLAFAQKAYSKRLRNRLIHKIGQEPQAPTACFAVVAGTTMRGTAECRTATTTTPTTGTTTTGSAFVFPSLRFQGMDFPREVKQVSAPFPPSGTKRTASCRLSVDVGKVVDATMKASAVFIVLDDIIAPKNTTDKTRNDMEDLFNVTPNVWDDGTTGNIETGIMQGMMDAPFSNVFGMLQELFPGSWFTDAQQHFGLSDSEIAQSVKEASAFFHMDTPLFIHEYRNTGVFTNLPFTDKDDVLVFNRDQMQNMGITEKDGFDLVMTHEGTHRMLQGSSYHLSPHQEELCCDFMSGVRAGLNDMDITQVENALADQPEGTAHPVGSLRVDALHQGQQYAEQYMAETGHAPTFEDCYGHFCDSFSESHHNAGLFSEDTDMLHEYSSAVSSADAEVRRCQSKVNSLYSEMQSVKSKYGTNSNEYKHVKSAYDKAQSALQEARDDYKRAMQNAIRTGTL